MKMPAAVRFADTEACSADQLVLEFWQGTMLVGTCRLPIKTMFEMLPAQASTNLLLLIVICMSANMSGVGITASALHVMRRAWLPKPTQDGFLRMTCCALTCSLRLLGPAAQVSSTCSLSYTLQ